MIPVVRPYAADRHLIYRYLDGALDRNYLTNNGPLVQQLTHRLSEHFDAPHLLLVANGTLAMQVAYRVVSGGSGAGQKAATTPFTFVATASSLLWEGYQPGFVDIDRHTWCLSSAELASRGADGLSLVVPVHVFGNACDVDGISECADRHGLKVVYDAAHAFDARLNGHSLMTYGDASVISFHATKLFHTLEGGAIAFRHQDHLEEAREMINFGVCANGSISSLGINAKMSEFHAAVGLANLDEMSINLEKRRAVSELYNRFLDGLDVEFQSITSDDKSLSYYPILLPTEKQREEVVSRLLDKGIQARRYFFPSLNRAPVFGVHPSCSVGEEVASRIVCLPFYSALLYKDIRVICDVVRYVLEGARE